MKEIKPKKVYWDTSVTIEVTLRELLMIKDAMSVTTFINVDRLHKEEKIYSIEQFEGTIRNIEDILNDYKL